MKPGTSNSYTLHNLLVYLQDSAVDTAYLFLQGAYASSIVCAVSWNKVEIIYKQKN
jgi:hypothetical protein